MIASPRLSAGLAPSIRGGPDRGFGELGHCCNGPTANRIVERKQRDKQARRAQILSAARRIAQHEGWSNVTVRRLSDEISYSQPVLYAHFGSRDEILAAVAIEGFQEIGLALEKARKRVRNGNPVEAVATAYSDFAASSPAPYEVMFSLRLTVPFDEAATPAELHFAFPSSWSCFRDTAQSPRSLTVICRRGSSGWIRTTNPPVNSRMLCR